MNSAEDQNVGSGIGSAISAITGPSLWDQIGAHDAYIADSIAKQKNSRGVAEGVVQAAMSTGQTVDEQDQARLQAHVEPVIVQVAQATQGMSDTDFQKLVHQVHGALGGFTPNNTLPGPTNPVPAGLTVLDQVNPQASNAPLTAPPDAPPTTDAPAPQNQTDSDFQNAISGLKGTLANPPNVPQKTPLEGPNWAQAGLSALGSLIAPRFAPDTAAATFQAISQAHDKNYADQMQQYQLQDQAWRNSVSGQQFLVGTLAQYQNHQLQRETQRLQRLNQLDEKNRTNASTLLNRYQTANTGPEKDVAARAYNAAPGVHGTALEISPESVAADQQQLHLANIKSASDEWEKSLSHELNEMGEVPTDRAKQLESQRLALASGYGIDPNQLRSVPTGETLKKQALDARKQQFQDNMAFKDQKRLDDFANKVAERDLAERRFAETTRHDKASEALGIANYGVSNYNAQLRAAAFNAANNEVDTDVQDALTNTKTGLERVRIPAQQAVIDGILKDPNDPTKAKDPKRQKELDSEIAKMNGLKGSADSLRASLSPNITIPNLLGGGSTQVPNPTYQPPQPGVTAPHAPVSPFSGQISPDPSKASKGAQVSGKSRSGVPFTFTEH